MGDEEDDVLRGWCPSRELQAIRSQRFALRAQTSPRRQNCALHNTLPVPPLTTARACQRGTSNRLPSLDYALGDVTEDDDEAPDRDEHAEQIALGSSKSRAQKRRRDSRRAIDPNTFSHDPVVFESQPKDLAPPSAASQPQ